MLDAWLLTRYKVKAKTLYGDLKTLPRHSHCVEIRLKCNRREKWLKSPAAGSCWHFGVEIYGAKNLPDMLWVF